jgi:hypothetical protein
MALFKRKHLELILRGRKTQTRRVHSYEWKLGRVYGVRDRWFGKPVAHFWLFASLGRGLET